MTSEYGERFLLLQQKCIGLVPYKEITRSIVLEIWLVKARKILGPILITTTHPYKKDSPPTVKADERIFSSSSVNNNKKILCWEFSHTISSNYRGEILQFVSQLTQTGYELTSCLSCSNSYIGHKFYNWTRKLWNEMGIWSSLRQWAPLCLFAGFLRSYVWERNEKQSYPAVFLMLG